MTTDSSENGKIQLTCKFFSTLKNIVGQNEITLMKEKGIPLKAILQEIQSTYFEPKKAHLLAEDQSRLEVGMMCLINDVDMNLAGGLKKSLKHDTTITLISSLHGG